MEFMRGNLTSWTTSRDAESDRDVGEISVYRKSNVTVSSVRFNANTGIVTSLTCVQSSFHNEISHVAFERVVFLPQIEESPGSYLELTTYYPDKGLSWFV